MRLFAFAIVAALAVLASAVFALAIRASAVCAVAVFTGARITTAACHRSGVGSEGVETKD